MEKFSVRFDVREVPEKEITIRNDAPPELREFIVEVSYDFEWGPRRLRPIICRVLRKRPDQGNWTEYPNIDNEVHELIMNCKWYKVYDILEAILTDVNRNAPKKIDNFRNEINDFFMENGYGWKISGLRIEMRGTDAFEEQIHQAYDSLSQSDFPTASKELHETIIDLSKRPVPDITGAIHHSTAALECIARKLTGNEQATLGKIIQQKPDLFPKPLDQAIEKCWGYASQFGRHRSEGKEPRLREAKLIVGICAVVSDYLSEPSSGTELD